VSYHQNAGQYHNLLITLKSLKNVAKFKHVGTTATNQNGIHKEIMRLNSENDCYHSVQNLLSFHLLSKNLEMKINNTIILPVVLHGCETWSLTLGGEQGT
jgi:hypothetical protein